MRKKRKHKQISTCLAKRLHTIPYLLQIYMFFKLNIHHYCVLIIRQTQLFFICILAKNWISWSSKTVSFHYVMLPSLSPAVWSNGNLTHKYSIWKQFHIKYTKLQFTLNILYVSSEFQITNWLFMLSCYLIRNLKLKL